MKYYKQKNIKKKKTKMKGRSVQVLLLLLLLPHIKKKLTYFILLQVFVVGGIYLVALIARDFRFPVGSTQNFISFFPLSTEIYVPMYIL